MTVIRNCIDLPDIVKKFFLQVKVAISEVNVDSVRGSLPSSEYLKWLYCMVGYTSNWHWQFMKRMWINVALFIDFIHSGT